MLRVSGQFGAWHIEQGSPQPATPESAPLSHRTKAVGAGGTQGAQQESLSLVVAVVGQHQNFVVPQLRRERLMPCKARRGFGPVPRIAIDKSADGSQWHGQLGAGALAMFGPRTGIGMQAVMHVDRAQAARLHGGRCREDMQQCDRIEAAAQADKQRIAGSSGQICSDRIGVEHRCMLVVAGAVCTTERFGTGW